MRGFNAARVRVCDELGHRTGRRQRGDAFARPCLRMMVCLNGVGRGRCPWLIEGRPWSMMPGSTCRWNARASASWTAAARSSSRPRRRASPKRWWLGRAASRSSWRGSAPSRSTDRDPFRDRSAGLLAADRSGAVVAMAFRRSPGRRLRRRAPGNPARARRVQDDAGEDRQEGRARDRAADAPRPAVVSLHGVFGVKAPRS